MPGRAGPRIAVIGNCQAEGVARALQLLLPDARVETILVAYLTKRFGSLDRLVKHLAGFDLVASHVFPDVHLRGGSSTALIERLPRAQLFPTITFPAFHPDMVLVGDIQSLSLKALVASPIGRSHSAIALAGFLEGLSVDRVLTLYTDAVFERLGYYELWGEGTAYLLRSARAANFDLAAEFASWSRRGCFMHDVNHPKIAVLADLARRLAAEAGLTPLDIAVEDYIADELLDESHWPVYPAVAERYGIAPSRLFRGKNREGEPPLLLDLRQFVEASHALYARLPREALRCGRVEGWRSDPSIRALFGSAGGA